MRKTWKIRYHQNSLTLNILPLLCAKRGKEIVLSAPYYRQVIALSPHCLWFKAQIKAAPKIKLHDKWSHKAPYWKSNLRRAFRFWRLQRQLQGSGCDEVALGVLTPAALCTCLNMATAMQTFTAPTHNCLVRTFTSSFERTGTVRLCSQQGTCSGFPLCPYQKLPSPMSHAEPDEIPVSPSRNSQCSLERALSYVLYLYPRDVLPPPWRTWESLKRYTCLLYTFPSQREMNELDQICQNPHRMF